MATSSTIQIRAKGSMTLPMEFRRKYGLSEGDVYTLLDLGDGVFVLSPGVSLVEKPGDRIAQIMAEEGVTLDEILEALDQEREEYYRDHYVKG